MYRGNRDAEELLTKILGIDTRAFKFRMAVAFERWRVLAVEPFRRNDAELTA